MEEGYRRCFRCSGRKKMYKHGSIYNHTDCGGVIVECPMCLGKGVIKDFVIGAIQHDIGENVSHEEENKTTEDLEETNKENSDGKKRRGRKKKSEEEEESL
jgi:CO dehydrogenase/acetyl-CoA synthase beta subunit